MSERIKVVLIEDHPSYRRVIEQAFESTGNIEMSGMFSAAEIALRHLQNLDQKDAPDVILLDLMLPGINGLEAIDDLLQAVPSARIIVLTQSHSTPDIESAICSGAQGYLLKSSTVPEIIHAVETVFGGGVAIDKDVAGHLLELVQKKSKPIESSITLSPREREILVLLSQGLAKKEIGEQLNLSYGTIATYVRRLYEKLDVQNAAAAVDVAYRSGIFQQEQ